MMVPSSGWSAFSYSFSSWRPTSRRAMEDILAETDRRLRSVLAHLRRLDLDPFPETLTTEGLEAALEELIRQFGCAGGAAAARLDSQPAGRNRASHLRVRSCSGECCPKEDHRQPGASLGIWEHDGAIHVRAQLEDVPELSSMSFVEAADRIGAVGGHGAHSRRRRTGSSSIEAVIPCAP